MNSLPVSHGTCQRPPSHHPNRRSSAAASLAGMVTSAVVEYWTPVASSHRMQNHHSRRCPTFPTFIYLFQWGGRNIVLLRLTPAPKSIILNASKTKTEIKKSLSHTPTKWLSVGVNRNVCQQRSRITQKIKTQNLNRKKKKKRNIWRFFQRRCVQFSTTLDIYGALGTVRYASNTRCIK